MATMASLNVDCDPTCMGSLLRWAPLPRRAVNVSERWGSWITPRIMRPLCARAMEGMLSGMPWTKLDLLLL